MSETVALITPPSCFLLDERVFCHLGILKVAAVLEQRGYTIDMLDLSGISNYQDVVAEYIQRTQAKAVGLTATTPQLPTVNIIVKIIRELRPDLRIILGGPHGTLTVAAMKLEKNDGVVGRAHKALEHLFALVDVVVAGDGESAVFLALADQAPQLVDVDDVSSPMFLTNQTLTESPFPARHLIDLHSYRYEIDGKKATSLIMQLGCSMQCFFCGGRLSPSFRRIRTRSIENVIAEIREIYTKYGFEGFALYDDELNLLRDGLVDKMEAISRLRDELKADFRLRGFLKSELTTEKQAKAMYEAGFREVCVGFESGSDRILLNIHKQATKDQNTRCVEILQKHGLRVKAFMSVGHPGESEQTIRDTHDWLLSVRPNNFDVTLITTYMGTPYHDFAKHFKDDIWVYTAKNGDRLYSKEVDFTQVAKYYKGILDQYEAYVYTDYLKPEELVKLRDWVEVDVREKLGIPFYKNSPAQLYEHSMGQMGPLPENILRSSYGKSASISW